MADLRVRPTRSFGFFLRIGNKPILFRRFGPWMVFWQCGFFVDGRRTGRRKKGNG